MGERPVLTAKGASEDLAKVLHFTMERLDPSEEDDWDAMDEQRKDFSAVVSIQSFAENPCSKSRVGEGIGSP